jgi:hypothetical protein
MTETDRFPALAEGEQLLKDPEELLLRQVNPRYLVDDGVPSWQAFRPMSADHDLLSTRRASLMNPREAYEDHCELGLKSVGAWGVTVGEAEQAGARAIDDSAAQESPRAHASIDFRGMATRKDKQVAAMRLAHMADVRGRLYP